MSTKTIQHEIEIDAPPDAVWAALTDTGSYADWNPFIRRAEGDVREGGRLRVEIAPPGARTMTFTPTVLAAHDDRELRWLGRFLVRGLFDGEHAFHLEPLPDCRTRLVQSERFSGLLVGPFGRMLPATEAGFAQMNEALKRRVEERVAGIEPA